MKERVAIWLLGLAFSAVAQQFPITEGKTYVPGLRMGWKRVVAELSLDEDMLQSLIRNNCLSLQCEERKWGG